MTIPVALPTVTIEPVVLHVPPVLLSLKTVLAPRHTDRLPLMVAEIPFTVTVNVPVQPVAVVYVITAVPAETPVTTPAPDTVATAVDPELQVPPKTASVNAVVPPMQMVPVPVTKGTALTVTTLVATQPATPLSVYVTMEVPAVLANTTPVAEPILITVLLLAVHTPTPSDKEMDVPGHKTPAFPVMGGTGAITLTVVVIMQPVPVLPISGSIL